MTTPSNPPLFWHLDCAKIAGEVRVPTTDISLRDMFAAAIVAGGVRATHTEELTPQRWAALVFEMANAMLAERERAQREEPKR